MNEKPIFEVTDKTVEESIMQEIYIQAGTKTSICLLMLNTGHECIGQYSPINREDVDIADDKKIARSNALEKATAHLKSITEWRRAIYNSQQAMENNTAQEDQKIPEPTE